MRRTLVQFDDETYQLLRRSAFQQERSISSLVRELVARGLQPGVKSKRPRRTAQFASVSAGRSKQGALSPVSEKHDAALAASLDK